VIVGFLVFRVSVHGQSIRMRRLLWTLLTLAIFYRTVLGQANPSAVLHDALVLENRGSFDTAVKVAKAAIDSRQLSQNELGRGYIILATAWQGTGDVTDAQIAFEHALQILEHDQEHPEDYASALENYAEFYFESRQPGLAAQMWRKAFHLRQTIEDHTGAALSLTHLAELAISRNKISEAQRDLQDASNEASASSDFTDGDKAFFFEAEGWLALAEHDAPTAVADYQQALELVERSRGEQHWLAGWEHILLGIASAKAKDFKSASASMQTGLTILERTLGQKNPKYFSAELVYSRVLDRLGLRAEAAQRRAAAEKASKDSYGYQCAGCTISVAGFR
jgi:tetratricopeptide (TPR) repeat protein